MNFGTSFAIRVKTYIMKKFIQSSIITLILISFSSCISSKAQTTNFVNSTKHFSVVDAYYTNWVGGQPGIKGITIKIYIDNPTITLDTLYFRNRKIVLEQDKIDNKHPFISSVTLNKSPDFILDNDPKKEYGNPVPEITNNIPFQLNENEAVISYSYKNTEFFKKITLKKITKH
jgi:hypothetical protein